MLYRIKGRVSFKKMLSRRALAGSGTKRRRPDFKWGLEKETQRMIQKKIPYRSYYWHRKAYLKTTPKGGYK